MKKKNKRYYKDKENFFILSSKHINSEGLWENVGLAIKVALDLGVKEKIIKKTIPKIKFEGRVQFIKGKLTKKLKKTKILIDGCHSDESTKNLAKYLSQLKIPIYGIWGSLKNKIQKNLLKILEEFLKNLLL